jgi:predicted RNase H-like HicB family nuclease
VPTNGQDGTRPDPKGARVVSFPDLPGCSSFFNTGIKSALADLAEVRRLWIDGPIQSKANIPEPTERGTRREHLSD